MFNRILAKQQAKESMHNAATSPMLVTAAYILMTTIVAQVVSFFIVQPFADIVVRLQEAYYWNYTEEEILEYLLSSIQFGPAMVVFFVVTILLNLYKSVVAYGYDSYTLRLARNEEYCGVANLLDGFSKVGRILWLNVLTWLFTTLWELAGMIPGIVLMVMGVVQENFDLIMGSTLLLAVGGAVMTVWAVLRYILATYFLIDDPDCTARDAISRSKVAMRGWKMEYIALTFSFLGWIILFGLLMGGVESILTALRLPAWVGNLVTPFAMVWLQPYMSCTVANFYDAVTTRVNPQPSSGGGYAGHYDYHGTDGSEGPQGPQPF